MRKFKQILELIWMLVKLPFQISNGNQKQAYRNIKTQMISVNLL